MADNTNNLYFKIGLVMKGAYSATATYAVNDAVQASDGLYASRKSNNTGHALSETEWWAIIVDLSETKRATEAANEAAENAQDAADRAEELVENFEHAYLEGQRVGVADNIAPQGEGSEVEFTSRALTDVEENSVAMFPKVMGRSLVWNQLLNRPSGTETKNGLTFTLSEGNHIVISGTATADTNFDIIYRDSFFNGHHFYINFCPRGGSASTYNAYISGAYDYGDGVFEQRPSGAIYAFITIKSGTTVNLDYHAVIYDLTQMFEVGNEPSTYEEFLQRKPIVEDEYAYDEGTNVNNKVEKVVSTDTDGAEVGVLDLSWIKEIKDENGVALFEDGMRDAVSAYDEAGAKRTVKRIIEIDLGSLAWGFSPQEAYSHSARAEVTSFNVTPLHKAVRCARYATFNNGIPDYYWIQNNEASMAIQIGGSPESCWLCINDPNYTVDTRNEFIASLNGVKAYLELATPIEVSYPAQNLCVKQTTGGVMTAEAGTGQNTTPFRAMLVNGLNAFGRLMAIGKTSELQTTAKTVVGAINEIYAMLTNAAEQSE